MIWKSMRERYQIVKLEMVLVTLEIILGILS